MCTSPVASVAAQVAPWILGVLKTGQAVEKVAVGPVHGLKPGSKCSKTGLLILKTSLRNATKEFFNRLFSIQPKKLALRVY